MILHTLDAYIQKHMESFHTPGASVAVTDQSETLWEREYGFRDLESRQPVCSETRFQLGSITKTFTAFALMQLYDRGEFDPQRSITDYLPWLELPEGGDGITGHQLLTHTSGLPLVRDDIPSSPYMARIVRECLLVDEPGNAYHQSEIGFQILWCVLERLSGEPYHEFITQNILIPLGMMNTKAKITHDSRRELAIGYQYFYDDRPHHSSYGLVAAPWFEYLAGDGCIVSTAGDMAIFLRMLLNRGAMSSGERLIAEETLDLMMEPYAKRYENAYYGYGSYVRRMDGHKVIGHGGDMPGFQTMMLGDVDLGVGAVVCINGPGSPFFPFYTVNYTLALLRAEMEGHRAPKEPSLPERHHIGNASDYAGQYYGADRHIQVSQEEGHLILLFGEDAWPLEKQGEDTLISNHPEFSLYPLHFVRDQSGKVIELEHGVDVYYAGAYPEDVSVSCPDEWQSFEGHYRMYSPWTPANFRVVLRRGKLFLVDPGNISYGGYEDELYPLEPGVFRVGSDDSPDILEFADVLDGVALRACLSGSWHYRASME